jgi:aminoglycoside 3-N-acetyltransferase I
MNVHVSRLTARDLSKLKELNDLFGVVFNDPASYLSHQPSDDYLKRFLAERNHIVLVAERDGRVVGGLVAYCLMKFERERTEIYLYDLAVAEALHRHGIGRTLVDELQRLAKVMGAYLVFVQADEGDEAVKFYEALHPAENIKTRNFDFET